MEDDCLTDKNLNGTNVSWQYLNENVFEPDPNPKNSSEGTKNWEKAPTVAELKTKRWDCLSHIQSCNSGLF